MSDNSSSTPKIKSSSQDQFGRNPNHWIGVVVGYDKQKEQIDSGWGWRYKVRIQGNHSTGQDAPDVLLDYAECLLPTTAGTGGAFKLRSVRISQGDLVFGVKDPRGGLLILGAYPRTKDRVISSGPFGALSGFYGSLDSNSKTLTGEFNEQIGPGTPGATALDPKEWTKATAKNPSEKVKEIVPSAEKNDKGEFKEISEEDTEKNSLENKVSKVNEKWKPGDNLNTATMEYLKESFKKGELPPATWETALKQASEQGLEGYEEYVIKEEIKEEVEPKKVEYKKTFVEAVNEAKNPPFDSWEKSELAKLADNDKARLLGNGKISISRETGITFQERTDILKEIKSIEGSLQYRAEVDPNQTIQAGNNPPQNLQQLIIPDSKLKERKERLLYLTKQLKYIEDGGVVEYPKQLTG